MARRVKSLHHNLPDGVNVPFHREHRSKKGRSAVKTGRLQKWTRADRRTFKNSVKSWKLDPPKD